MTKDPSPDQLIKAVRASRCVICVLHDSSSIEGVLCSAQVGSAILFGKPLFVIAPFGCPVSVELELVAKKVVRYVRDSAESLDAAKVDLVNSDFFKKFLAEPEKKVPDARD